MSYGVGSRGPRPAGASRRAQVCLRVVHAGLGTEDKAWSRGRGTHDLGRVL